MLINNWLLMNVNFVLFSNGQNKLQTFNWKSLYSGKHSVECSIWFGIIDSLWNTCTSSSIENFIGQSIVHITAQWTITFTSWIWLDIRGLLTRIHASGTVITYAFEITAINFFHVTMIRNRAMYYIPFTLRILFFVNSTFSPLLSYACMVTTQTSL